MQDSEVFEVLAVTTTVGSLQAAKALALQILQSRLAACVQLDPGLTSLYHWKGELCEEPEVRLVIKSLPGCEAGLQALFAAHHPYELPQFLTVRMAASHAYAQWVGAEVEVPSAASTQAGR